MKKLVHEPKWSIFYDVHTMPAIYDVGANFDAAEFASKIADCGVDYIVFHARCNLGMAYYNTKIGIRHPSLKYDLFGRLVDECGKRNIAVSAYFNAGLSHEEALRHREWTVLSPEGYTYKPDRMDNFFRRMCYNTGYADHLVAMVEETVSNYPVSGVFLDCFHKAPCVCPNCIQELKRRGIDWRDERELVKFTSESAIKLANRISKAINRIRPGLLIYFNGITFEEQKESGSYLEFECLPTGGWGYELLPVFSRYMRHLGKLSLNMTGRFHEAWGDFGGIRTEASVEYDCAYGLANGMPSTIGDHFHPRGDINHAVFSLIRNVYKKLRRYQPWFDDAEAVTEVAVIVPKPGLKATDLKLLGRNIELLQGTARMLSELKVQFDILTDTISWEKEYKLMILPDYVLLDDKLKARISAHLKLSGKIISSCDSGLDMNREKFALEEWGLEKTGEVAYDPAYFAVREPIASGMPDMPLTLYGNGVEVQPGKETKTLADIVAPYFNREWDGEHGNFYAPPEKKCGAPAVTLHDGIVHFSHPVFISYQHRAQPQMKRLMANIFEMLLPEPLIKADDLPSFARVILSRKENQLIIHLFSYLPELRGTQTQVIEEAIQLRDVKVKVRVDNENSPAVCDKVESAIIAPDGAPLDFSVENGYAEITIPIVEGYAMVVLRMGTIAQH